MAQIVGYREVPLSDLEIGKSQVRTQNVGEGIDELAENIRKHGLLHPIVVCPGERPDKYEILLGQRRFLAHQILQRDKIMCAVFDEKVEPIIAKVVSLSENMIRRGLDRRDLIDVCTGLYKYYGSIQAVIEATGLPASEVRQYVKYDRLIPELKELVDKGNVDIKVALKAQDAASVIGPPSADEAIKFAEEMQKMSGPNRERLVEIRVNNPKKSADEVIDSAKTGARLVQLVVTLGETVHSNLQAYAKDEGTTQADAAADLIEEGLLTKGFMGEDDA